MKIFPAKTLPKFTQSTVVISIIAFSLILSSCHIPREETLDYSKNPADFVDPFIGTGGHGHTYPGATVPFGMVQLSPDNGTSGWDWCSGYNYSDSIIIGFSHTHLSGTGIGDLYDVLFRPTSEKIDFKNPGNNAGLINPKSSFSHSDEKAVPGYYSVLLKDFGIKAELTATKRTGFHKYTFTHPEEENLIIDLGHSLNWDSATNTYIKVENDTTVVGYRRSKGWATDQYIYFAAVFSKPVKQFLPADGSRFYSGKNELEGKLVKAVLNFDANDNKPLMVKVGVSAVDINGAIKNLNAELPGWDFDGTRLSALNEWNKNLSSIKVAAEDTVRERIFYTALYHTMLAPTIFCDVDGRYRGTDGKVHSSDKFVNYTTFSLWDTFRAEHPLMTIIQTRRVPDFINSMLAQYRQTGLLPVWPLVGNETNTMIGYHAVPVIVDAFLKGIDSFNKEEAYRAIKNSAMQNTRGLKYYKQYGYIPYEKENESVSKTLEYSFDDWCVAQMAKALGRNDDYKKFSERSEYYKNLFDSTTGFMRGRDINGNWKEPFDPKFSSHRADEYTEGNAWQYTWFVPQDVGGLIKLMGGRDLFAVKLDSLFNQDTLITGAHSSPDISGLIGQYAHGNEPSHHISYLYDYAGFPWKTQERVRQIMKTMYKDAPNGLAGNEDCGQMSAWYVFSAMGFYPLNPASGVYFFGSPVFERVELNLENGNDFIIMARNVSADSKYIQRVELNGKEIKRPYVYHKEIMDGGKLIFYMGNKPDYEWNQ